MRGSLPKLALAVMAVITTLGVLGACDSGTMSGPMSGADDRAAIEQIRKRVMDAENAGDASVFDQVAAEDVVVMPPNTSPISGRAAAAAAMGEFFRRFEMRIEYASREIQVHGDFAFDRGTYSQSVTPKSGGDAMKETGNYLWLYKRGPAGQWQQSHAIWNSDQRPPAA